MCRVQPVWMGNAPATLLPERTAIPCAQRLADVHAEVEANICCRRVR
jgi:hypothetical protein